MGTDALIEWVERERCTDYIKVCRLCSMYIFSIDEPLFQKRNAHGLAAIDFDRRLLNIVI